MAEDIVKLIRNTYPVPDLAREGQWHSGGPILGENVCRSDRRWYSKLEPHERLFSHQTMTSARRNARYRSGKVPRDSLDGLLTSVYDHDVDLFLPKMYMTMQPESMNQETWRVLRNQIKEYTKGPVPLGHEIRYVDVGTRQCTDAGFYTHSRHRVHPSSLQLAIEGPHTDRTNPGFTRKIDGSYFGIV